MSDIDALKIEVVYGPPCCGKTTYVRNAATDKSIIYDYDAVLRAITKKENHTTDKHPAHSFVIDFRRNFIQRLEGTEGIDRAFIITRRPTKALKEALSRHEVDYTLIDTPIAECLERLGNDETRPDKSEWEEIINKWYRENDSEKTSEESEARCLVTTKKDYRIFEVRAAEENGIVEGYAAVFESPAVLYEHDGVEYKEVITRTAFDSALMADVFMNYNHQGKPVARTKNGTLQLEVDPIGLKVRANLSGTEESRRLYEEIKGGYIDKMSFAFMVTDDGEAYDKATHTRRINKFKRIFDVAAVDMPAYDSTSIQARSYWQAKADAEATEARMLQIEKDRLKLKLKIGEMK